MKLKLFLLLFIVSVMGTSSATYAGFWVKKHTYTTDSVAAVSNDIVASGNLKKEQRIATLNTIKHILISKHVNGKDGNNHNNNHHHGDTSGWEGIVSFICGLLSFMGVFSVFGAGLAWLFIPAIVFGIIGLGRHKQHRGLALAGLILGCLFLFLALLAIVLAIAVLSAL